MPLHDRDLEARVRDAILEHLRRSPRAADTAEGIAVWWIQPTVKERVERELVERVLEQLVAEGTLRRHALPDGVRLYSGAGGGGAGSGGERPVSDVPSDPRDE